MTVCKIQALTILLYLHLSFMVYATEGQVGQSITLGMHNGNSIQTFEAFLNQFHMVDVS